MKFKEKYPEIYDEMIRMNYIIAYDHSFVVGKPSTLNEDIEYKNDITKMNGHKKEILNRLPNCEIKNELENREWDFITCYHYS